MTKLTIKCPAKVNLFLHITGKREDGYHNLYTLFYPVSICDNLTIEKSDNTILTCSNPDIPCDNSNIILKTHNILRTQFNFKDNYKIHLEKNIPFGAGLGGGSSNAAKYLLGINKLSNLNLSYDDMKNIMAQVGSDTVFFLHNEPMIASGRGEILEKALSLPPLYFIIINPNIFISTKEIYSSPNLKFSNINPLDKLKKIYTFEELVSIMNNDMESVVFALHKEVAYIVDYLNTNSSGKALMSGSGSTVFAVYENEAERDNAFIKAKEKYKSYFIEKAAVFNDSL